MSINHRAIWIDIPHHISPGLPLTPGNILAKARVKLQCGSVHHQNIRWNALWQSRWPHHAPRRAGPMVLDRPWQRDRYLHRSLARQHGAAPGVADRHRQAVCCDHQVFDMRPDNVESLVIPLPCHRPLAGGMVTRYRVTEEELGNCSPSQYRTHAQRHGGDFT
jgi:hypothetical protein